ncbi:class I SAM-dependent methyltransferase [Methylobacterium symbioticum]|uniref:Methyltransferase type 11 domain-containing protein n=1 Tax=Methylobacterium symbioticum TaxID=2584084 RepID=A0A509EIT5_9HYPH|nr:methyltransferase domain-containing protein [Methylobacterium symbioticum]VUD74286.1 hypothetical protein MET9862_04914 [Methylobacterium symbioticum]
MQGEVYLCRNGRRHYMRDLQVIQDQGFEWSDVQPASSDVLNAFAPAQMAPRRWRSFSDASSRPNLTSRDLREISACTLQGVGLEVGALASPFPVPIHCDVIYGDVYRYEDIQRIYDGEPQHLLVRPLIQTDFATLKRVADDSLDFLIASHVIEHTTDPIGAIRRAGSKLRDGGHLVLVVPDIARTFDRRRDLTTLDHLIADYEAPSPIRDTEHYKEFYAKAYAPEMPLAPTWEESLARHDAIHFHTWTYESFLTMAEWVCGKDERLSVAWSHPTLPGAENFEFYVVMRKACITDTAHP